MKRAVEKLIELEEGKVNILAFSIGGAIAWGFGIESNKINSLICVSSTRLRQETIRPKGEITLYFGENDTYKPKKEWFEAMRLDYTYLIVKNIRYIENLNLPNNCALIF